MSTVSLLYDGYEIIQDTIIEDANFESFADGRAGTCHFRVKDAGNIDAWAFHGGGLGRERRLD